MFRVFSKFNGLFIRPKVSSFPSILLDISQHLLQIRGAIQEYQTQLIESVKEDITRLQDKVRSFYQTGTMTYMIL